jgi:hypothetical protein
MFLIAYSSVCKFYLIKIGLSIFVPVKSMDDRTWIYSYITRAFAQEVLQG